MKIRFNKFFSATLASIALAIFAFVPPAKAIFLGYYDLENNTFSSQIFLNDFVGIKAFYDVNVWGHFATIANIEAGFAGTDNNPLANRTVTRLPTSDGAPGSTSQHATGVTHILAGRGEETEDGSLLIWELGMAPSATIYTGAIAAEGDVNGTFGITNASFFTPYYWAAKGWTDGDTQYAAADVINSSWSGTGITGKDFMALSLDALAYETKILIVASAGNDGRKQSPENKVGSPASGFNTISVGALGGLLNADGTASATPYDRLSDFSSIGPVEMYIPNDSTGATGTTVQNARAAVDIVAPGEGYVLAYDGDRNIQQVNAEGTSFSAPTVAGGLALLTDTAKQLKQIDFDVDLGFMTLSNVHLKDSTSHALVMKSILLTSANRDLQGWDNGQRIDNNGVTTTTQSLDWKLGAGAADFASALRLLQQIAIHNLDIGFISFDLVAGMGIGASGWNFETIADGTSHNYLLSDPLRAGDILSISLVWFVEATYELAGTPANAGTVELTDAFYGSFLNLDLQLYYRFTNADDFKLYAQSVSLYNTSELLVIEIPFEAFFKITVTANGYIYNFTNSTGTEYALSWDVVTSPIPEPAATILLMALGSAIYIIRRRKT